MATSTLRSNAQPHLLPLRHQVVVDLPGAQDQPGYGLGVVENLGVRLPFNRTGMDQVEQTDTAPTPHESGKKITEETVAKRTFEQGGRPV